MARIYLFECAVYTDNSPALQTIYVSTGDGYNHPSAPAFYEGRIASDAGVQVFRAIFNRGEFGAGEIKYGVIEVVNNDGALDTWLDYGYGRNAELYLIEEGADYSTKQTVLSATIDNLIGSSDLLSLQWSAKHQPLLDNPCSPSLFAGTGGLEGGADLKGQRKPRTKGKVKNITPILIDNVNRVLAWNYDADGVRDATHSIDGVYFNGSPWNFHADYATAAALIAGTHGGNGHYSTCKAESLILMGGSVALNGAITIDVTIEATASDRYAGKMLDYFLKDAGVPSGDISSADVTALNTDAPYELGIYIQNESYLEVCNKICESVAAWFLPDRFGVYRMAQIQSPATEDMTFKRFDLGVVADDTTFELMNITPILSNDYIPYKEIRVQYQKNWTVIDKANIASAVTANRIDFLSTEWRTTEAKTDAGNEAKYLNAQVFTFETLLYNLSDANAMRDVFADIYSVLRREYDVQVRYDSEAIELIDIGKIAKIVYPKLGLGDGKNFNIHGIELNLKTNIANLKVWG
jgi:hypothetical protein